MKHIILVLFCALVFNCKPTKSVKSDTLEISEIEKSTSPKLVVGIVVDQMRYDYLTRFYEKYYKRL